MSKKINTGGPAFPHQREWVGPDAYKQITDGGMTLRDWFAGQFMCGQMAFSPRDSFDKFNSPDDVSRAAYEFADAMLRAREGGDA